MIWQAIIAGGTLGLISSFHCVGMCGPLALSLPVHHLPKGRQLMAVLLYNAGRVITYTFIGLLLGIAGHQLFLAGWQQWFSVASGILVLVFTFQYFLLKEVWQPSWLLRFHLFVQTMMSRLLAARMLPAYLLLGMANGLLPCGMVYLAIAGALSAPQISESALFMLAFGSATLPAMLATGIIGMRIDMTARRLFRRAMPYMVVAVAILLILRGLNLGIPFLSPAMATNPGPALQCH